MRLEGSRQYLFDLCQLFCHSTVFLNNLIPIRMHRIYHLFYFDLNGHHLLKFILFHLVCLSDRIEDFCLALEQLFVLAYQVLGL